MTARLVWKGVLIELSKIKAPSIGLDEFNYYFNKAINQYINKQYNTYDMNQQASDNCRVLKATAILKPEKTTLYNSIKDLGASANVDSSFEFNIANTIDNLYGATYEVSFPSDYLHLLNCVCIYKLNESYDCWNKGSVILFGATRLVADSWSTIINDYYNRPQFNRPYFYIHHVNKLNTLPTNAYVETLGTLGHGTDFNGLNREVIVNGSKTITTQDNANINNEGEAVMATELSRGTFTANKPITLAEVLNVSPNHSNDSLIERRAGVRYGNASETRCEIRYGKDDSVFELKAVSIDYLKAPQHIRLTQEQVDMTRDTSQMMEFPDYVCQEIINEMAHLIMLRDGDPILGNHQAVTLSIALPAQQLAAPQQA